VRNLKPGADSIEPSDHERRILWGIGRISFVTGLGIARQKTLA
jgi:hypothetical protein